MAQVGPPLSLAQPTTPPSSPNIASSEPAPTLNNVQQFIEMVKAVVAIEIASTSPTECACSHTPPESPNLQSSTTPLTVEDLEQLILRLIEVKSADPAASLKVAKPTDAPRNIQPGEIMAVAAKPEYKTVNEVYVIQ